jgi:putative ABC transport system substrate-binding protein
MRRRLVRGLPVALLLALLCVSGGVGEAQRARPVRIGVLTAAWGATPQILGFREGLKELGYLEDRDFTLGVRFTQGNVAELPAAARDLVRLGVDVIVAAETSDAAEAARRATDRIPIVFIGGSDPIGLGLVRSLARPGGNVTGIADLDIELVPKRMELFREIVPMLKRVVFVYDGTNEHAGSLLRVHREAARRLGLALVERPVRSEAEARAAIAEVGRGTTDGLFSPRALALNIPGAMLEASAGARVPGMFYTAYFAEQGALASYGPDQLEMGRGVASLVDRIVKGARPADLPVLQPTKFELVINLRTARALGLTLPQALLLRADRLIE